MIPIVAALVGYVTNWLAVQMIFYPIKFRGLPLYIREGIPLGLFGWQGIVPCKSGPMSDAMVEMVTGQLLDVKEVFGRLDPRTLAKLLSKGASEITGEVLPVKLPGLLSGTNRPFLRGFVHRLQGNIVDTIDLRECVRSQMLSDRSKLGELFQICGSVELKFLTNSGLWFGFLLVLIQMVVSLFWTSKWCLSIGGGIVGFATNWLALKWIFQPVMPTKFGPFVIQGMFLKRQKEVASEFSKFFANNVLTSERMFGSMLENPDTRSRFEGLFSDQVRSYVPAFLLPAKAVASLSTKFATGLKSKIHVVHGYVDAQLGLEGTLRKAMLAMTPQQFERVLHPIFEEDETTLIIAGAVLGLVAGLIQQGFATGRFSLRKGRAKISKLIGHK